MSHEDKAKEIERHFGEVLSKKQPRTVSLNWNELNYLTFNLAELEVEITEEKIKKATNEMSKENAPGPDVFIGAFSTNAREL
jgi:hypothetical protein